MDKNTWDSSAIFVFFCHSGFRHKKVHPFRNFLAVLPPPTLCKVETRKKILDTRVQHCLWAEGRGLACVNWKTPRNASVPRLLSMIVKDIWNKSYIIINFFQASLRINCVHCDDHFFILISFPQFLYDLFHMSLTLISFTGTYEPTIDLLLTSMAS